MLNFFRVGEWELGRVRDRLCYLHLLVGGQSWGLPWKRGGRGTSSFFISPRLPLSSWSQDRGCPPQQHLMIVLGPFEEKHRVQCSKLILIWLAAARGLTRGFITTPG